ncbi:MAG: DUF1553 domain-containing protein [Planctomycetaceae bacterium]|nr:DUF1553 domain-containing protein [Planctomycetaceae bacterium]
MTFVLAALAASAGPYAGEQPVAGKEPPAALAASRPASRAASRAASRGVWRSSRPAVRAVPRPDWWTLLAPAPAAVAPVVPQTPIDVAVSARLKALHIEPAPLCSDAVFVRRAYLDVIGTLPTAEEALDFIGNTSPDKRRVLIDRLMQREEFADYWAMKWGDILRIKAEFPINLWPNAAQAYHHWVLDAIRKNKPYDVFARELLTAGGSNFSCPEVNFYRAMQNRTSTGVATTVALTFMGTRAEKWPKDRLAGMAGFFDLIAYKNTSEWKEEIVYFDLAKASTKPMPAAVFPDGTVAALAAGRDPRVAFADWLITPKNPWFTRAIVNRSWSWLLGRGIIHETDDIRPDNPPSNPELLALLERELIASKYDLRGLFRLILNSQTYQRASAGGTGGEQAAANFARYPLRRLDAEVLIDALCQISGTTEKYTSAIPEPFTFIPADQRAIALPDGSITSTFLDMFGRPARDTGLDSERNNRMTPAQRLHLLNSTHVGQKIQRSLARLDVQGLRDRPRETMDHIYLTILSRYPTRDELIAAGQYLRDRRAEGVADLVWAMINSDEFLYRH